MSRYKFPASVPRKVYYSGKVGGCDSCPDCGEALECEQHTYLTAIRRGDDTSYQIMGNTAGHFCGNCPVVVLDREEVESFMSLVAQGGGNFNYVVMGIVDLEAVPEDKRNLPFDEEDNPLPLVEFLNMG